MWLKISDTIIRNRKIHFAAKDLGVKHCHLVGHLIHLWHSILLEKIEGIFDWDAETIAYYADFDGDPDLFLQVLIDRGLVDRRDDGMMEIHGWEEYAGCLKEARRKREYRAKKKVEQPMLPGEDFELLDEPQAQSFIDIPLTPKDGHHPVTEDDVTEYIDAFPGVDVRQQLRTMRQWCLANPQKRKTRRGIKKFIVGWLGREQDRGAPVQPRRKDSLDQVRQMLREDGGQ